MGGSALRVFFVTAYTAVLSGIYAQSTEQPLNSGKILPPQFENTPSSISIYEQTPTGTVLMNITASDPQGRPVTFSIRTDAYFKLANIRNNSVDVVVNGIISFSKTQSLDIEVTASTTEGGPSTKKVTVTVLDLNNHAPVFMSDVPNNLVIPQHTAIGTIYRNVIHVTDADRGKNADQVITCNVTLSPACAFFNITYERNSEGDYNASITVAADLSYDDAQSYTLALQSTDKGIPARTTTKNFVITIKDTEGKPPMFDTVSSYKVLMNERLPIGTNVANVTAWDGDVGIKRAVNISIINDTSGFFDITPVRENDGKYTSALVIKKLVVRESVGSIYYILLQATEIVANETDEEAFYNLTSVAAVKFIIQPTNNYPPRCDHFNGTIAVTSLHVADRIPGFILHCSDNDEAPYNSFKISILNDTGILKLTQDRADKDVHTNLVVIDEAAFSGKAGELLRICVLVQEDVINLDQWHGYNDTVCINIMVNSSTVYQPVFRSSFYQMTVDVTLPLHSVIATVHASDGSPDSSGAVSYSLVGPGSEYFAINASTGEVTVIGNLAQIIYSVISLQVIATNDIGRLTPVDFQVILNNAGGTTFQPKFYNARVAENRTVFESPVAVRVTGPLAGKLSYVIVGGNDRSFFRIDSRSGVITLTHPLRWYDGRQFTLRVSTNDTRGRLMSQNDEAVVDIMILARNLNPPIFNSSVYTATVNEAVLVGTRITQVVASDADDPLSPYGQVTYFLRFGNTNIFRINANDGVISLIASLDQRTSDNYTIVVLAQDGGNPPLSTLASLLISIAPSDTRPPVFKKSVYIVDLVNDMLLKGASIVRVEASVVQSNTTIRYGVDPGSFSVSRGLQVIDVPKVLQMLIAIDSTTGDVSLAEAFNNTEEISKIKFKVTAIATNGQVSSADIQVNIQSGSSRLAAPIFLNRPWLRSVDNRIFANVTEKLLGVVTRLVAYNPATGSQAVTFREVASTNNDPYDMFSVSPEGDVLLKHFVDSDAQSTNDSPLSVLVEAIGDTNLTSTASVVISVLRMNNGAPRFLNDTYACTVRQNATADSKVCDVSIDTSGIQDSLTDIQYGLAGFQSDHFYIDHQGTIRIVRSDEKLGKDSGYTYNLFVYASRLNGPTATAKLVISIEQANLYAPICASDPFYFYASIDTKFGSVIGSVVATDDDYGQSLTYVSADPSFMVAVSSGDISPMRLLPQRQLNYSFAVIATDTGQPQKQSKCSVTVIIQLPTEADSMSFMTPPHNFVTYRVPNPRAGTCVTTLATTNRNESVHYRLINTAGSSNFYVDNSSALCFARSLDVREGQHYELIVAAKSLTSSVSRSLSIQLEDQPAFDGCLPDVLLLTIRQPNGAQQATLSADVILGTVTACSRGNVTNIANRSNYYGITSCDNSSSSQAFAKAFRIDSDTGEIFLSGLTNYSSLPMLGELCVYVSSSNDSVTAGEIHWWNTRRVRVMMSNSSVNPVHFSQKLYTAVLSANVPVSTAIISVRQNDFLLKNVYAIKSIYLMTNGTSKALTEPILPLRIDNSTGIVYSVLSSYDDYVGAWYNVTLSLVDEGDLHRDSALLTVYVVAPLSQLILVFGPSFSLTLLEEFYSTINVNASDYKWRYRFITEKTRSHVDPHNLATYTNMTDVFVRTVDLAESRLLTLQEEVDLFMPPPPALVEMLRKYPGLALSNSSLVTMSLPDKLSSSAYNNGPHAQPGAAAAAVAGAQGDRNYNGWDSEDNWLWWVIIAAALVVVVEAVILSACLWCVWRRHQGYSSRIYDIRLAR